MGEPILSSIVVDRRIQKAAVDDRLFGGFVEHLGRSVYGGIYEPGHETADESGFRTDVIEMVQELGMPVMRYPGGNFVSGYHWEDGVGPKASRPKRIDPAWQSIESNQFGINEFVDWCKAVDTDPMLAVNLGTRGPEAARELLEYCNHRSGTALSDLRRSHGYSHPHGIKHWCLGNEMDGAWQIGHTSAYDYGQKAAAAARLMKMVDPRLLLAVCGSSNRSMATFGDWELEVLSRCYEQVDYVSLHTYYGNNEDDTSLFLSRSDEMDAYIAETVALADAVRAKRKARNRVDLSFDEWNVWFHSHAQDRSQEPWTEAPPLLEDVYTLEDAVLVGSMLTTLLNNADRVKIACLAQTVNVIAPIMTQTGGSAWKQTIFYPFAVTSRLAKGSAVLHQAVKTSFYDAGDKTDIPYLASTVLQRPDGSCVVLAANRSVDSPMRLSIEIGDAKSLQLLRHTALFGTDPKATNTAKEPMRVVPQELRFASVDGNTATVDLPPCSWNALELTDQRE